MKLVEMCSTEFPVAKDCLEKDRNVDDIPTVDENQEGREEQIRQFVAVLNKVKLPLKHISRSGEKPGDKATTDAKSTKWYTEG